ncbi:hypothetical protein Plhal304r1_c079g0165381 [Plasmopara halstedii]
MLCLQQVRSGDNSRANADFALGCHHLPYVGRYTVKCLNLIDGYYYVVMREEDVPLTAVSTPPGILWEWLCDTTERS